MTINKNTEHALHRCPEATRSEPELNQLVQILYFQPIFTILCGHALSVLITIIYLRNIVPLTWLLPWAIIITAQSLIWGYIVSRFRRKEHQPANTEQYIRAFPIAGMLTGIMWGLTLYWPNVIQETTALVFLSIMILGVTAAGLAVFAPYLRSFSLFSSFTLLPFSIRFFIEGTTLHTTLGIMFLLYFGVLLISGINMRRAVAQSIKLRLQNTELIDDLLIKNEQTENAREDAVQANISKSKFLAAASHDLRQPLHALGLFVDALESRIHYKEVKNIVDNIRISTDALSDLLNALLDISKLDAGVMEPKTIDFQLRPLLQRIQTDFADIAKSKSIRLRIVDCGMVIHTDPSMLERILRNLVSNAIRYTSNGSVLLGCRRHGEHISIEVHDTGVGIEKQYLDNIFEEFYQIENPERDRSKGLGLGLAIVKRLSQLIDCPVNVRSTPRTGTVFTITVPFVSQSMSVISPPDDYVDDVKGIRALVIDDEQLIRQGMCQILHQWGCETIAAESIEQAIDLLDKDCNLDIILTDYRLRENQTGDDAIKQIIAHCGQQIPAIILTGDTDPQRLREAKESGYKLLHKPVSSAKLRSLMSYLLEQNKQ